MLDIKVNHTLKMMFSSLFKATSTLMILASCTQIQKINPEATTYKLEDTIYLPPISMFQNVNRKGILAMDNYNRRILCFDDKFHVSNILFIDSMFESTKMDYFQLSLHDSLIVLFDSPLKEVIHTNFEGEITDSMQTCKSNLSDGHFCIDKYNRVVYSNPLATGVYTIDDGKSLRNCGTKKCYGNSDSLWCYNYSDILSFKDKIVVIYESFPIIEFFNMQGELIKSIKLNNKFIRKSKSKISEERKKEKYPYTSFIMIEDVCIVDNVLFLLFVNHTNNDFAKINYLMRIIFSDKLKIVDYENYELTGSLYDRFSNISAYSKNMVLLYSRDEGKIYKYNLNK